MGIHTLYNVKKYHTYILANKKNGTLYVGYTDDIRRRILEHKSKINEGFTSKYDVNKLVYFETSTNVEDARLREKKLKKWNRKWKIELIESVNKELKDLSEEFPDKLTEINKLDILFR